MKPFLRRLYRKRGISRLVNGVAVHPYGPTMRVMKRQVRDARRVMNRNGHRRGGIWIGEIGWASAGDRSNPMVTTRKGQARRLGQAVRILVRNRERWRIRGIYTYVWRDHQGDELCNWCRRAGLLSRRGKPKPALRTYGRAIASHRG